MAKTTMTYNNDGRLTSDGTRAVSGITYHPFGNLPKRITMDNGNYTSSNYLPDGTLTQRQYTTKTIRVVTTITADGDTIIRTRPYYKTAGHTYKGQFEKTSDGWLYHTGAGFYDLKHAKHYWYLRDRIGSTVAVIDANGNYHQTTAYYPSGTPYQLPNATLATAVDASTDRLHIGNRWMSHSGLNWYDNTARMHDPVLMHFASADPLYTKYPDFSPWSHCAADPINYVDPSGCIVEADEWSQAGILDGFEEYEKNYIQFKDDNTLDTSLLNLCDSESPNFRALKTLANSNMLYIVSGVTEIDDKGDIRMTGSRDDDFKGQTQMPGESVSPSKDGNVHIYTSLFLNYLQRATNIAHELYGHAYFYELKLQGEDVDPIHRSSSSHNEVINSIDENGEPQYIIIFKQDDNPLLEYRIREAEEEALRNAIQIYQFQHYN